jgi:hypothetical protein
MRPYTGRQKGNGPQAGSSCEGAKPAEIRRRGKQSHFNTKTTKEAQRTKGVPGLALRDLGVLCGLRVESGVWVRTSSQA